MKNLQESVKEFGLYQYADIPERYKTHNFENRTGEGEGDGNIPEFLTKLKGYEFGVFYGCKQDTDYKGIINYYVDHHYTLGKKADSEAVLMLMQADKKYYFYPLYNTIYKYRGISHYIKEQALKAIAEPNRIGVFTEKKVLDWFTYNDQYLAILENVLGEINGKNAEHEKKIADFIKSVPGCKVSAYEVKTWITTHFFQIIFTHNKAERYLSYEVTYKGTLTDITRIEAHR